MKSGIYTITNLVNGKIYVGYSKNILGRFKTHKSPLNKGSHSNIHLQRAWNEYKRENFLFEVLEFCEERFLFSQEHYWCNMLNTHNDKYGYNILPTHPYQKNSDHSKYSRLKISNSLKDGKTCIPIIQLNLDGSFIEEFISLNRCEEKTGVNTRSICNVAKGRKKSTHGFIFKYKKDYSPYLDNSHKPTIQQFSSKEITQFTKEGKFIRNFPSARKAGESVNRGEFAIYACCLGHNKTCAGYKWEYCVPAPQDEPEKMQ